MGWRTASDSSGLALVVRSESDRGQRCIHVKGRDRDFRTRPGERILQRILHRIWDGHCLRHQPRWCLICLYSDGLVEIQTPPARAPCQDHVGSPSGARATRTGPRATTDHGARIRASSQAKEPAKQHGVKWLTVAIAVSEAERSRSNSPESHLGSFARRGCHESITCMRQDVPVGTRSAMFGSGPI